MNAIQIADIFDMLAVDHAPDGWPAVQQKQLTEAALMLRKQHEAIVKLRGALEQITNASAANMAAITYPLVDDALQALADTEELVK